jgi:hypothetical protein
MKRIFMLLTGILLSLGFYSDAFAQENLGLGRRANEQYVNKSRVTINPPKCLQKVTLAERFFHVYDENGRVSLVRVPSHDLQIRVRCPESSE